MRRPPLAFGDRFSNTYGCGGIQYWRRESVRIRILHDPADVCGDAIHDAPLGDHVHLQLAAVDKFIRILLVGQEEAPNAELIANHGMAHSIPIIKIADQSKLHRFRRPLAIPHAGLAPEFAPIESEVFKALADLAEQAAGGVEMGARFFVGRVPGVNFFGKRFEPRIDIQKFQTVRGRHATILMSLA